jgi:hypothetical protein
VLISNARFSLVFRCLFSHTCSLDHRVMLHRTFNLQLTYKLTNRSPLLWLCNPCVQVLPSGGRPVPLLPSDATDDDVAEAMARHDDSIAHAKPMTGVNNNTTNNNGDDSDDSASDVTGDIVSSDDADGVFLPLPALLSSDVLLHLCCLARISAIWPLL